MWSERGALIEYLPGRLMGGYGKYRRLSVPTSHAFYVNDFFLQEKKPWVEFEETFFCDKKDLVSLKKHPEVAWFFREGIFRKMFAWAQHHLQRDRIIKAVPYTCFEAPLLWNPEFIAQASASESGRLVAFWDKGKGFLGVTPEVLFLKQGEQWYTEALAGTGEDWLPEEHHYVVSYLQERLFPLGAVTTYAPENIPYEHMHHRRTRLIFYPQKKYDFSFWIDLLHPTPALGVFADTDKFFGRDDMEALLPRGYYGAPFGFYQNGGEHMGAFPLIRTIFFDKGCKLFVGAGVVKGSCEEKELVEIKAKGEATLSALFGRGGGGEGVAFRVIEALVERGCQEFVICPGARNACLVHVLEKQQKLSTFFWPEERSAAFFALGRARITRRPVAVITTSGTAVGELLPAMMEAFYTGIPLVAVTADRPRRYRGTGAPQSADQVHIFGKYAAFSLDIEDTFTLPTLPLAPCHLNISFEEPPSSMIMTFPELVPQPFLWNPPIQDVRKRLDYFFLKHSAPVVLISTLEEEEKEAVLSFVKRGSFSVIVEATSGIRERVDRPFLGHANAILRLGGVPTTRLWRDVEEKQLPTLSLSRLPFSGGPGVEHIQTSLTVLQDYIPPPMEASWFSWLSCQIPEEAMVFLGNSLPIREWDLAASLHHPHPYVYASRGLNGIDGQISTFLGMTDPEKINIGIFGDLTTLYDMAAFWIIPSLKAKNITIVVVNNGGGKIFSKMFVTKVFQNEHTLSFEALAAFWGLPYVKVTSERDITFMGRQLVEIQTW